MLVEHLCGDQNLSKQKMIQKKERGKKYCDKVAQITDTCTKLSTPCSAYEFDLYRKRGVKKGVRRMCKLISPLPASINGLFQVMDWGICSINTYVVTPEKKITIFFLSLSLSCTLSSFLFRTLLMAIVAAKTSTIAKASIAFRWRGKKGKKRRMR